MSLNSTTYPSTQFIQPFGMSLEGFQLNTIQEEIDILETNYWLKSGTTIYYTQGNVGIGTSVATSTLDLVGDFKSTGNISTNLGNISTNLGDIETLQGYVGIGTSATTNYRLEVEGDVYINGNLLISGTETIQDINTATAESFQITNDGYTPNGTLKVNQKGTGDAVQFQINDTPKFRMTSTGFVGFNTTANPQYNVDIRGDLYATKYYNIQYDDINNRPALFETPVGEITAYYQKAGSQIRADYLICDGTEYLINDYPDLGAILPTSSPNKFKVPDLRDRFIKGLGQNELIGTTGGSNLIILHTSNLPAHRHEGFTNLDGTHTHDYNIVPQRNNVATGGNATRPEYPTNNATTSSAGLHKHSFTTSNEGSNVPYPYLPPYYSLVYIIKAKYVSASVVSPVQSGAEFWSRSIISNTQSNLFYTSGNIGIGNANPDSILQVSGLTHTTDLKVDNNITVSGTAYLNNVNIAGNLTIINDLIKQYVSSLMPIGTMLIYNGQWAGASYYPSGTTYNNLVLTTATGTWLICDGSPHLTATYLELAKMLNNNANYNQTYFNTPDMRNRIPRQQQTGIHNWKDTGGNSEVSVGIGNLPAHTHGAGTLQVQRKFNVQVSGTNAIVPLRDFWIDGNVDIDVKGSTASVGNNQPLNIENPFYTVGAFIIKAL